MFQSRNRESFIFYDTSHVHLILDSVRFNLVIENLLFSTTAERIENQQYSSFNLVIENLLFSTIEERGFGKVAAEFQSRNRESFIFYFSFSDPFFLFMFPMFQSRNRESFIFYSDKAGIDLDNLNVSIS